MITAAVGVGSFAGGIVVLRVHPARPLLVAQLAVGLWSIPWLMLAIPAATVTIAGAGLAGGAGLMVFNALWETTLQQQIPSELLSRVSAYDWFGSIAFEPVGMAAIGFVACAIGISETLWVAGAIELALSLAVLAIPSVRHLERASVPARRPAVSTAPSS